MLQDLRGIAPKLLITAVISFVIGFGRGKLNYHDHQKATFIGYDCDSNGIVDSDVPCDHIKFKINIENDASFAVATVYQGPPALIEIYGEYPGEPMAIINVDGTVELNSLYSPNEPALVFWETLAATAPCR